MSVQTQITQHIRISKAKHATPVKSKEVDVRAQSKPEEAEDVLDENVFTLKQFDMDIKFGPSLGLNRLERWERAHDLGLNPPQSIKGIILSDKEQYIDSLWKEHYLLSSTDN